MNHQFVSKETPFIMEG